MLATNSWLTPNSLIVCRISSGLAAKQANPPQATAVNGTIKALVEKPNMLKTRQPETRGQTYP